MHFACSRTLQCFRELIQRRTGGHDVIHHGYDASLYVRLAHECTADVRRALFPRQRSLRPGFKHSVAKIECERRTQPSTHVARDLLRLVEAALTQTVHRERHRHDDIHALRCCGVSERVPERRGHGEIAAVLERVDQRIDRKIVGKNGTHAIEAR